VVETEATRLAADISKGFQSQLAIFDEKKDKRCSPVIKGGNSK